MTITLPVLVYQDSDIARAWPDTYVLGWVHDTCEDRSGRAEETCLGSERSRSIYPSEIWQNMFQRKYHS